MGKKISYYKKLRIEPPKERKPMPPPTRAHERRKYTRKVKHKKSIISEE